MHKSTKLLAIYFPQFHRTPENDMWWGDGFTDWQLVRDAKPLFEDHYQPRIPLDENYYNPCEWSVLQSQIELARKFGVYGFMFYHYWFDGKLILEKPLETFRDNIDLDFPFCLSWANGSWTRQWIGNNEILLEQKHLVDETLWTKHFEYLLPFFKDRRAIKIDNKPVFCVYNPNLIQETRRMFALWDKLAKDNGLDGIYYIAMKNYEFADTGFLEYYDGLMKFQPREANTSKKNKSRQKLMSIKWMRGLPEVVQNRINGFRLRFKGKTIRPSNKIWEHIIDNAYINDYPYDLDVYESAFFDWDNTARYRQKATIYTNLTMKEKERYMLQLKTKAENANSPFIVFNAWNEWSESAYLEPDIKNGFSHLEIIRKLFK